MATYLTDSLPQANGDRLARRMPNGAYEVEVKNHRVTSEADAVRLVVEILSSASPRCAFVRCPDSSNLLHRLRTIVQSKIETEVRNSLYGPRLIRNKNIVFFPIYQDNYYDTHLVTDFVNYELEALRASE